GPPIAVPPGLAGSGASKFVPLGDIGRGGDVPCGKNGWASTVPAFGTGPNGECPGMLKPPRGVGPRIPSFAGGTPEPPASLGASSSGGRVFGTARYSPFVIGAGEAATALGVGVAPGLLKEGGRAASANGSMTSRSSATVLNRSFASGAIARWIARARSGERPGT